MDQFDVYTIELSPTKGSEQAGRRPCVVVSPTQMNSKLRTVIIAPMTTVLRGWPTRIEVFYNDIPGEVAIDQLRTVDKTRLGQRSGTIPLEHGARILVALRELFA